MKTYVFGFERIIEQGLVPDADWERIRREAARDIHQEIMRKAPRADEDPQVGFDYKKSWHTGTIPRKKPFGSDYDYWAYVVDDAFSLWSTFAAHVERDYFAERIAGWPKGASIPFYTTAGGALQVWQNAKPVTRGTPLEGPQIDIGPTADFSVFLERWTYSKRRKSLAKLAWNVGVMHAIARQLAADYHGIHTIFVMPIRPKDRSKVRQIDNRNTSKSGPIVTFPVIRVLPRYYTRHTRR